ncbi:MAG TPA: class I SAM-dependent methyltransferase [Candidatus Methylomirabilis sp.]|nr:class I SAM-dependent methyltransferase [Candidatus Methylomirabilis sp.]
MSVFGSYSNYYDLLYKDKNYPAEVDFIDSLFKKYATKNVKVILDMGCGTGGHALLLAEKGYDVTGIDGSEDMLSIALKKARKANLSLKFIKSDICNFNLNKKFDAVISMFAVMGYQTSNEEFEKALMSAGQHLKPDGLFIFDVWFGPAVISQKPGDRIKIIENNGEKIIRLTRSALDIMKHRVDVNFNVMTIKGTEFYEPTEENHQMRFFFPMELEFFFKKTGFKVIKMIPFMQIDGTLSENNWDMTVIAAKK